MGRRSLVARRAESRARERERRASRRWGERKGAVAPHARRVGLSVEGHRTPGREARSEASTRARRAARSRSCAASWLLVRLLLSSLGLLPATNLSATAPALRLLSEFLQIVVEHHLHRHSDAQAEAFE